MKLDDLIFFLIEMKLHDHKLSPRDNADRSSPEPVSCDGPARLVDDDVCIRRDGQQGADHSPAAAGAVVPAIMLV
jgi:hypothetical protein